MLKRTLACALFAITGHAYSADIQVTTLVDEDKDDAVCSLREAVEFINKRSQTAFENGYHGCGNKEASSIIVLERDKQYTLNKALEIKSAMTIMTASSGDFRDDKKGIHNATIKMIGTERLFLINDGSVENALISVMFNELNLHGSATKMNDGSVENALISVMFNELNLQGSATKMNDGGLIYNREALNIQYSRLMGGNAVRGGAIYNAGILSDAQKTAGIVLISNSILQSNKADQGAVIYTEMPIYNISHSVIRDNEVIASSTGALIFTQTGFTDETIGTALLTRTSGIRNSTIFHNKGGYVANIREGMIFNNVTMIKNAAGLYLQAANWNVPASGTTTTSSVPSAYVSNNIRSLA